MREGVAPAMITEWMKGKSLPAYKYLKKLCDIGMTAKEMFGEESGGTLVKNSTSQTVPIPNGFDTPEFREGVAAALADMKAKGLI